MRHVILIVLLVGSLAIAPVAVGDDGGGFLSIREWVVEVWNGLVTGFIPSGDHGPAIEPGGLEIYDPESDFGPAADPGGFLDPVAEFGPVADPSG